MKNRLICALVITIFISSGLSAASMVTVNSTADTDGTSPYTTPETSPGSGIVTLRSAIQFSQGASSVAPTTIIFDIPTTDSGFQSATNSWRISPIASMALNAAYYINSKPVIINGYLGNTAHLASANTNPIEAGSNAILRIEIRGPGLATPAAAFRVDGVNNCEFRGLCINGFTGIPGALGTAIRTTNSQSWIIAGNFIGLDITGMSILDPDTQAYLGFGRGHQFVNADNSIYGGNLPADSNVISGNTGINILFAPTNNILISGNYMGTNKLGTAIPHLSPTQVGNANNIEGIGVGVTLDNNIMSGTTNAIFIAGGDNWIINNNKIGTNAAGTEVLGNFGSGIYIANGDTDPITSIVITNNLISGNLLGIRDGANYPGSNGPITGVTIQGNKIGTDITGKLVLGNKLSGIQVQDIPDTLIEANIISGNQEDGIRITEGSSATNVTSNKIGTDVSGNASEDINGNSFGNILNGVRIGIGQGAASDNTIGI